MDANRVIDSKIIPTESVVDSGGDTDSENGYPRTNGDSESPVEDSSDSGHDSHELEDEDDSGMHSCGENNNPTGMVKLKENSAIVNSESRNNTENIKSDIDVIKNAMKNVKLESSLSANSRNSASVNRRINSEKGDSTRDVSVESKRNEIRGPVETTAATERRVPNSEISEQQHTNGPIEIASNSCHERISDVGGRVLNSSTNGNSTNSNSASKESDNSTNSQDDNSKLFTIIHDLPKNRVCKKCPKFTIGCKEWRTLLNNLFPRVRHCGRIAAVVAGSALLLLTVFLLIRLPSSPSDVTQPAMYDLPEDDAFRPAASHHNRLDAEVPNAGMLWGGRPGMGHPPGSDLSLRELARQHGVVLHPELGVPVDEEYIKLEKDRKFKLAQLRAATKRKDITQVLQMVKDIVEDERSRMNDKEKKIWSKDFTPLRILLVSTWRSGSTFLGQVLVQHPGVFEHYEPFSYAGVRQIRSGTEAFQSQQFLHRLLECRFSGQDMYLNYTQVNPQDMIGHNKRIWGPCTKSHRIDLCSNATFLTEACNMFPIQLVKSVRLRLNLTQLFLGETRLNAKVVFLIRDPRATMNSRRSSVRWCDDSPDCSSPEILCSDLKEDLKVAAALERLYPNSFTMLRYEDLANDPQNVMKKLFDFLGMYYSKEMADFVAKHTESEVEKPWSIARKSAARVSRWKEKLKPQEIREIESVCKPVLEKLNYEIIGQK